MGDYDREIARERGAMASSGQGTPGGSGGMGGMTGEAAAGGPMVTIPSMSGGGAGGGQGEGGEATGGRAGGGGSGGDGEGGQEQGDGGKPGDQPESKIEIPEDVAKATGSEDQVARQIREAAEQEEDPRIRDALWEEYRRHMGMKSARSK